MHVEKAFFGSCRVFAVRSNCKDRKQKRKLAQRRTADAIIALKTENRINIRT